MSNLRETHILRKIDETCDANNPVTVDTQFGEVIIKRTSYKGFVAIIKYNNRLFNIYSSVASVALLNLGDALKGVK